MKDSIANTLANAPRPRVEDTRSGLSLMKWVVTLWPGNSYNAIALRSAEKFGGRPVLGSDGSNGVCRYWAEIRLPGLPPGRAPCGVDHSS